MLKQILIVDDSESIREVLAFSISNAGFQVLVACDGIDALKYFDGRTIDLLLTDYHMPNLNGLELILKVRQIEPYKFIPILVLTTENQVKMIKEARESGATGWLTKPFNTEKLLQTLRKVIR
ncbi:MAG: response regulator [Bacteroidota bacterium]|nr:two-component system response regulator [Odoribacter sp.]MDP3643980.1 response regulator [Bacteroidota bacterium]